MKVILLKDLAKLGRKFDVKEVSSGHALNLLIPCGEAIAATRDTLKRYELLKAKEQGDRQVIADLIAKNLKDLDGLKLSVASKANDKGHLFAGLHREAVAAEIFKQTKLQIDPAFISLDQPLKTVGEHEIVVTAGEQRAKFTLVITAA